METPTPPDGLPIFAALAAEWRDNLREPPGRHHWTDPAPPRDPPTQEVPMSRHADHDGDGTANQADPDWLRHWIGDPHQPSAAGAGGFAPEHGYEFPDPGWRPESDFTGEWVDELITHGTVDGETS